MQWRTEHNPTIPAALYSPTRWMLGSSTGAKVQPFTLADVPRGVATEDNVIAAVKLLWDIGVIKAAA